MNQNGVAARQPAEPPTLALGAEAEPGNTTFSFTQAQVNDLGTKCYTCHNTAGIKDGIQPKGKLALFDDQNRFIPARTDTGKVSWVEIYDRTHYTDSQPPSMPPAGVMDPTKRLLPDTLEALRKRSLLR